MDQPKGVQEVYALIGRLLGPRFVDRFELTLEDSIKADGEYFSLATTGSGGHVRVQLAGNSGVNIASALNYYLKYYGQCSFSWTGNQCGLSVDEMPMVPLPLTIPVMARWRYYMNTCTFGYSTVWWQWDRWEQEIDWMALNGYNMPLAFIGQEYVWIEVYKSLGLHESDLLEWMTGAAFLPWHRMGNVNSWGHPLTMAFITAHRDLQIQILTKMRSYGMHTVLPGFAGHVPTTLIQTFPEANITMMKSWNGFPGTSYLSPSDPLYATISTKFIEYQSALYGTDHLYNIDPFNELTPPSAEPDYLRNNSQMIFQTMVDADPQAIWILQSWFLLARFWGVNETKAFLEGVPIGGLIVLDLYSDAIPIWNRTQTAFNGHNWIWCMLHNFGGRPGMYGRMLYISEAPIQARAQSPGCVGTGLTPEAIEQNVIVYDLMSEMSWRSTPPDLKDWTINWTNRRYGYASESLVYSRYILVDTVYNGSSSARGPPRSFLGRRPKLNMTSSLYYDPDFIVVSWELLLHAAEEDPSIVETETYRFDLAEITMQALTNKLAKVEMSMNGAYLAGDMEKFSDRAVLVAELILGMDKVAGTQQLLLLGTWTARARSWATKLNEPTAGYEFDARNQITLWGPSNSTISDYAYKHWSGLIRDYYFKRWELFIHRLAETIYDPKAYNETTLTSQIQEIDYAWNLEEKEYPTVPSGNVADVSTLLLLPLTISRDWVLENDKEEEIEVLEMDLEIFPRVEIEAVKSSDLSLETLDRYRTVLNVYKNLTMNSPLEPFNTTPQSQEEVILRDKRQAEYRAAIKEMEKTVVDANEHVTKTKELGTVYHNLFIQDLTAPSQLQQTQC
eukprot:gene16885-20078_t